MNRSLIRDRHRRSRARKITSSILVTDNIVVRFEGTKRIAPFKLVIFNDSDRCMEIENIDSDLETVVAHNNDVNGIRIRPDRDFSLNFSAVRHYDELNTTARIRIFFKDAAAVTRFIQIIHNECAFIRKHAHEILRQKYPIPTELFDIMDSINSYEDRMAALDALDAIIPSTNQLHIDNYTEYFHGLLYLEQLSIERNFRIYHRDSIMFQRTRNRYAIEIEGLFETRPSLSIGDWAFARKNSASHIIYEGKVVELEEDLVRIEFGNDFKRSFKRVTYEVTFLPNSTTFLHGHRAIDLARKMFDSDFLFPQRLTELRNPQLDVILNVNFNLQLGDTNEVFPWFNDELNNYQREAVKQVLRADCGIMPHIIYGPPGTGKSTTLTETILQLHRNVENSRILISAQSNSTVNLLAQLLIESGNLCPSDLLRLTSFYYVKADKMPHDLIAYSATIRLNVSSSQNDDDYDVENTNRQIKNIDDIKQLKNYRLIIGTTAAMSALVENPDIEYSFSHVIIDEAGQCTEVDCLIPMLMAGTQGQVVLAGDPKQMPPLVFDIYARDRGLSRSFLCRLLERYSKLKNNVNYIMFDDYDNYHSKLVTKLVYNYRSLPCILDYVNEQFYNMELMPMVSATFSREARTLNFAMDEGIVPRNNNGYGIYFFNVHGNNMKLGTTSWSNEAEMDQISDMVQKLTSAGICDEDIGVISPYYLQVRMIRQQLCENLGLDIAVGTVEEFQGQEKLIILLSTVRTCKENARLDVNRLLGFLNCPKRLNVAASRARALFVVFGKAELLEIDENWRALINSCKSNGTFIQT